MASRATRNTARVRILADDHPIVLASLESLLRTVPDTESRVPPYREAAVWSGMPRVRAREISPLFDAPPLPSDLV